MIGIGSLSPLPTKPTNVHKLTRDTLSERFFFIKNKKVTVQVTRKKSSLKDKSPFQFDSQPCPHTE